MSKIAFALDRALFCQHRNPILFFQMLEREGTWRTLWPARLIIILLGVFILPSGLVALSGEAWAGISAAVAVAVLLAGMGFFMIFSAPIGGLRPGLWLAYLLLYYFSLPILVVVLLCALAALTPVGLWLGWYMGMPLVVGIALADTCSLAVYQSGCNQRAKRARLRAGGPPADLTELTRQQWAWRLRVFGAGLLVLGALASFWVYGRAGTFLGVMLLSGAIGCGQLASILLAALGWPLVDYAAQTQRWHATYVGRTAVWTGPAVLLRTIMAAPAGREASAVVLALLQESCLSWSSQRACAQLPPSLLPPLLLHLSLREGGGEALRFLSARLPPAGPQPMARLYADLATEAAKPLDLQRWIVRLPAESAAAGSEWEPDLMALLVLVRTALLQYQAQPIVLDASHALRHFVQSLEVGTPPSHSLSWPLALSHQLEQHQQRLQANE